MKRRVFLGTTAGTLAAYTTGCQNKIAEAPKTDKKQTLSVLDADATLGGKTLEELREQYRFDLFEEYIPFHDKWVVDHKFGGYTLKTGWNGPTLSYEKSAWYEGRGAWTYSFLYNKIDSNPDHLAAAQGSVEFIMKHKPDGDHLWPGSYSREGKVLSGSPSNIYGDIFLANAFSEYSKATGDNTYWNLAKDIMFKCLRIYDTTGYYSEVSQSELGSDTPLLSSGARVQGHWFVLLRLGTQMLEFKSDPEVETVNERCVDMILNRHYNPDYGLNQELLNHDFSRPGNEITQYVCTGHSIETLWMVLFEAVRLKDKALFNRTAESFRRHCEVAWDDVYGGVFYGLRHVDDNVWWVHKPGWCQMEALIGLLCIIEHTGDAWAKEYFNKLYPWVMAKFPLKQYGYPLWIDYADRKVTFDKGDGSRRAENFHHPRQLMLNFLSVERMIERGGMISGIF